MDCLPHYTTSSDDCAKGNDPAASPRALTPSAPRRAAEPRSAPVATPFPSLDLPIGAWGFAQAQFSEFDELRRKIPSWAAADTPAHFFRYTDEQTILAAWAIDDAMRRSGLRPDEMLDWGVIAAPEFLGRHQIANYLDRFHRNGGPRVSPNSIVQHSLHSVSGTLSILLSSKGPNVGVGGGREAFVEGLLSALTLFELQSNSGCWFVATAWDPAPLPDEQGNCLTPARCHAVALAIRGPGGRTNGSLVLHDELARADEEPPSSEPLSVPSLIQAIGRSELRGSPSVMSWRLPWGATLGLDLRRQAIRLRRAA